MAMPGVNIWPLATTKESAAPWPASSNDTAANDTACIIDTNLFFFSFFGQEGECGSEGGRGEEADYSFAMRAAELYYTGSEPGGFESLLQCQHG